ncbi:MAG: asparagine synthase (glutamine-hydrolyzing) [Bacteroidetes bacterium]|nr:asparagine synthase (glutamine-hydrolyzing) [Bacteroidota bacterium]
MCGIVGVLNFSNQAPNQEKITQAIDRLCKRGPDGNGLFVHNKVVLGHTRLSIIDTSATASQPFTDNSGRYTIIFNGEFFNYQEHRKTLADKGFQFRSHSDTEVLLQLYIKEGPACLQKVNGFFALAIYDNQEQTLFVARDRMGVKPLLYFYNDQKFVFASEMKAMMELDIPQELDTVSLQTYLHLNYIPTPFTIFKNVKKLEPGNYFFIRNNIPEKHCYYSIKDTSTQENSPKDYESAKQKLVELMDKSVQLRLISDVPLGCFLSGGIDSSVIAAIASKHTKHLSTFSIGFKDEPLFDETHYAQLVAKMHGTNHTVFSLTNADLFEHLNGALDYIDEPFADSSALAVYILSKETRKQVTVALSGDGADELFAGYNKHYAAYNSREKNIANTVLKNSRLIWEALPKSRNSKFSNLIRKIEKYSTGLNLNDKERYWRWAGFTDGIESREMLHPELNQKLDSSEAERRKSEILKHIGPEINSVLHTDMELVLVNDMLTKVDMMSMANSLEVRTPFLDYNVVDFAFSLPEHFKIDKNQRKKIVKDAFRNVLPDELYTRNKQGFEVPLLNWFKSDLRSTLEELLSDSFIRDQKIFKLESVQKLKAQLFSTNPQDSVARIWALLVFQTWWKNLKKPLIIN